jgi:hypothetical protein
MVHPGRPKREHSARGRPKTGGLPLRWKQLKRYVLESCYLPESLVDSFKFYDRIHTCLLPSN